MISLAIKQLREEPAKYSYSVTSFQPKPTMPTKRLKACFLKKKKNIALQIQSQPATDDNTLFLLKRQPI